MKTGCKHLLLTRFNITLGPEWQCNNPIVKNVDVRADIDYLERRFDIFERFTFPSVSTQTIKDFTWLVLFHEDTPQQFKDRISALHSQMPDFVPLYLDDEESLRVKEYISDYLRRYDADWFLTSRTDNDDVLHKDYIRSLQEFAEARADSGFISYPSGLQYSVVSKTACRLHYIDNHFISLLSPGEDGQKTVLSYSHDFLPKEIKMSIIETPSPMWIEMIHPTNLANRISLNMLNAVRSTHEFDDFSVAIEWNRSIMIKGLAKSTWYSLGLSASYVKEFGLKKTLEIFGERLLGHNS